MHKIKNNYIFGYIALIAVCIVMYHFKHNSIRLPYFDGSHHFAEQINYAESLKEEPVHALNALWSTSPELSFSYTLLAAFNNLMSCSRNTITAIYFVLLAILFLGVYRFSENNIRRTVLIYACAISSTILLSNKGGLLDSRIDIISILIFSLSLILLLRKKFCEALLILLIAAFFKSSMLFLALPVMIYLLYKVARDCRKINLIKIVQIVSIICLAYSYIDNIFLRSISYNLMSTGGGGAGSSFILYLTRIYSYISQDFLFYGRFLVRDAVFSSSFVYLFGYLLLSKDKSNKKLIIMYLLFFVWTYLLMTSNPLHERVLLIWFYPVYLFGIFMVFKVLKKEHVNFCVFSIIFLIQISVIAVQGRFPSEWNKAYYEQATLDIKGQAKALSEHLDSDKINTDVIIFVNFLSNHGPVSYNYDVYRVLLHENLEFSRRIYGWELGSYSDNWEDEFKSHIKGKDKVILILQENPMGIPQENNPQKYGEHIYNKIKTFIETDSGNVLREIVEPIDLPHIGRRYIYEFNNSEQSIAKLFSEIK